MKRTSLLVLAIGCCFATVLAQINPERRSNQELPRQDSTRPVSESLNVLPDTVILKQYDPRFHVAEKLISDSMLNLGFTRYDPVAKISADYVSLNGLMQPAILNPILGTSYERIKPLSQSEHPVFSHLDAPYFDQNIPFSYVAYNQGGEIDDGQVRALLGRSFANGWKLSFQYDRTYNSGSKNTYPNANGERVYLGTSLAYVPDSSHHRAYASMVLRSKGFFNSGGYTFASDDTISVPEDPFLAESNLTNVLRTEGTSRRFAYLHRYFLKRQVNSSPKGLAASVDLSYTKRKTQTSSAFTTLGFLADSAYYGLYSVDERGLRYDISSTSVLAEADVEYFTSSDGNLPVSFNFRAGLYGGSQRFDALYLDEPRSQILLGLNGELNGTILNRFFIQANTDIPLGERVGEGLIDGSISWSIANKLKFSGQFLLERSTAPLAAEVLGINSQLLQTANLSVSTHSKLGVAACYIPLGLQVQGYLDLYSNPVIYREFGIPETSNSEIAIPTLSYNIPINLGPFTLASRGVLRNPVQSQAVRLPGYTGQNSLFGKAKIFKKNMDLIVGIDSWIRSPVRRYGYFPLTNVFYLDQHADQAGWQYNLDFFLAFKVKSFKAFVRLDRIIVSDSEDLPATVEGYPIARAEGLLPRGSILRLGVSFFLFD